MLFLIGHEDFTVSFFVKKDETLILKRDVLGLGADKMSKKMQLSKNEMQIEYREDGGHVTMKSCVLNGKQRRNHCQIINGDKLCVNKVEYFKVHMICPKYFGELVYDQWNWQMASLEGCEFICKKEFDLLLLIALKLNKPVVDINKLTHILDFPKDPFELKNYTSGNDTNLRDDLLSGAIIQPATTIDRIILIDFIFFAINLSETEANILKALAECFNAQFIIGNDSLVELDSIKLKHPELIILPISNSTLGKTTLSVLDFKELYEKIINDSLESVSHLNSQPQQDEEQPLPQGTDFLQFFLQSNRTNRAIESSQIQTQSSFFESSQNTIPQSSILLGTQTPHPSKIAHRSFMESQKAFNETIKQQKPGEVSSLSQAFGIDPEEIKRRIAQKKQLVQQTQERVEDADSVSEPALKKPKLANNVELQPVEIKEVQAAPKRKRAPVPIIAPITSTPVIITNKQEKRIDRDLSTERLKMSDFHIVERFPVIKLMDVHAYNKDTLHTWNAD